MTDEIIGYTIDRRFEAPRQLVWEMFTMPEHFAYWWGGPSVEVPLDSLTMDVRPGGSWKATMIGPGREWTLDWAGEYLEVDEPRLLVMTLTDDPTDPARDFFRIELLDDGDGTLMHFAQGGGNLTPEQYELTRQGTSGFLDAIAERLAQLGAR